MNSLPTVALLVLASQGAAQSAPTRDTLVVMSGKGDLAIRQGPWKYIPDLNTAHGWQAVARKPGTAGPGLYNLTDDPGEIKNLHAAHPEISERLAGLLKKAQTDRATRP